MIARLEGNLLMMYCVSFELASELHGQLKTYSNEVSDIVSKMQQKTDAKTHFFNTKDSSKSKQSPHFYSAKNNSSVSNRKLFTSKMRQDAHFSDLMDENIAKQNKKNSCNTQQPTDLIQHEVVVPHWDTTDVVQHHVKATAKHLSNDGLHLTVQHGAHTWDVPHQHVHPVKNCNEVRLGSCVFLQRDSENVYDTYTIVDVALPNNRLECGFAGEQSHTITLPPSLTFEGLQDAVKGAINSVDVQWDSKTSKLRFVCKSKERFTLWNTSPCLSLLGFNEGSTYETHYSELHKAYVLESVKHVILKPNTPLELNTHTHLTLQHRTNQSLHDATLDDIVPLRPQYKKDGKAYAYLSAYQTFPIRFLSPERPQRGLLLYHEMGSGKSRTSIEMAQRDLEHRFWTTVQKQNHTEQYTKTHWQIERPPFIVFSPTQEARDHYVDGEIPEWLACWWSEHENKSWFPIQHVYTSFHIQSLQAEIREHERKVIAHLKQTFILPIVYTNNTRNLFEVVKIIRKGVAHKTLRIVDKKRICEFFQCKMDDALFDIHPKTDDDEFYSRFFKDTFVVIDEMHNLCNSIANSAEQQRPESNSGCGTFFYRCLMEAPNCRVVGLTGTPIQRTPLSLAPLFNIISGKEIVYNIRFTDTLSLDIKNAIFAQCRPYAETIWVNCKQSEGHNFAFSPWKREHVLQELHEVCLRNIQSLYKKNVSIECRDYERFAFAFKQTPLRKFGTNKAYVYDNMSFMHKYVKNSKIHNVYDFIRRIIGLVSYISPPKLTADTSVDESIVSTKNNTANVNNEYPEYTIRTVYLTASKSQLSYIQSILTRKKEINQRQADIEQRSGCNVNWNAVPTDVLDGKTGLLKLFFKGKDTLTDIEHEQQYHQLLYKVHSQFSDIENHPELQPCLDMNKKLQLFSPKMFTIVKHVLQNKNHKAVVYSEFIDGVGKYGLSHASQSTTNKQNQIIRKHIDEKHIGLSGLGLLGYVLESNGCVRFQVNVIHPLEVVHRKLWAQTDGTKRGVFMAIGSRRYRNTELLKADDILDLCNEVGIVLTDDETHGIQHDIMWTNSQIKVNEFCRKCLMVEQFSPHFMTQLVRFRLALDEHFIGAIQKNIHAPVFVEYSDRCVTNQTSKHGLQFAKRTILKVYNLKKNSELDTLNAFTPSSLTFLTQMLQKKQQSQPQRSLQQSSQRKRSLKAKSKTRHSQKQKNNSKQVARGNAYASLIQTLFVSTSVTEGVEFKDVRTMHILEPPKDYRQLEQMFGRVIRRGSHAGLKTTDRSVDILLYVLSTTPNLKTVKQSSSGQMIKQVTTADEMYWNKVIKRKYEISQEFYQLLKHVAVDCRHNLVLNSNSFQDKQLSCFEFPYQRNLQDWNDSEVPLVNPMEEDSILHNKSSPVNAIDIQRIMNMIQYNN